MSFLSPKLEARGFGAGLGLPNSSQELFLKVAIPIALPDGACGMDEVSNGGFDEKPKVEISHKIKGWRCPKLFFPKPKQRTSPVNESTHAAKN